MSVTIMSQGESNVPSFSFIILGSKISQTEGVAQSGTLGQKSIRCNFYVQSRMVRPAIFCCHFFFYLVLHYIIVQASHIVA